MPVTDQEFATLSRRVADLEASEATMGRSIEFIARTLAQMKEVQDTHTKGIHRVEADVKRIEADLRGLRNDMSGIVAAAMREVGQPKSKPKAPKA
jgi:predicted  nucleic acid-binding Zn-ribbon protein